MVLSTRFFINACFSLPRDALCHNYDDSQLSSQLDNLMFMQRSLFLTHIPFCIPVYRHRMIFNQIFCCWFLNLPWCQTAAQVGQQHLTLELGDNIRWTMCSSSCQECLSMGTGTLQSQYLTLLPAPKKGIFKDRQTCIWLFGSIQAISVLLQVLPGVRSSCLVPASKHHRGCAGELGESESPCPSQTALPNTYPHVWVFDWLFFSLLNTKNISHARDVVHGLLNSPLNTCDCSCFWKVHKAHGREGRIFGKMVGKKMEFFLILLWVGLNLYKSLEKEC